MTQPTPVDPADRVHSSEQIREMLGAAGHALAQLSARSNSVSEAQRYRRLAGVAYMLSPHVSDLLEDRARVAQVRKENDMMADALMVAWTHLQKRDPVLTHELYQETPALQDALRAAREGGNNV